VNNFTGTAGIVALSVLYGYAIGQGTRWLYLSARNRIAKRPAHVFVETVCILGGIIGFAALAG